MKSIVLPAFFLMLSTVNTLWANDVTAPPASTPTTTTGSPAADAEVEISPDQISRANTGSSSELDDFCFFHGLPAADAKYTVIRRLKLGKGTYGSVLDIIPTFAQNARAKGADAIIQYDGSQRFGFWPWRFVRPVVRGTAIRWNTPEKKVCASIGGTSLKRIMETNQAP